MTINLVTGGAGFIGSNLVDYLVELGQDVICVDNESANNDNFFWNSKANNFKSDITDYALMKKLMKNVDYVFHLAAESRLQPAIENPIDAVYKNCVGTTTILQCAREAGVKRVVYSSTSSAYGNNPYPNKENQPNDCLNPYSASKAAGEDFCKMYFNLYGLETIILRYFNVFGERSPTTGQYSPVIGIFYKQKESGVPLTIVGDGSQKRDFINVKDVVKANIIAASKDISKEYLGQVFNIGSGKNISIKEIADLISSNQVFIEKRSGEMETTLADVNKAKKILNWQAEINIENWIRKKI